MKITDILKSNNVTISCEVFPPKMVMDIEKFNEIVRQIAQLNPSFVSVTYGASGGNSENTVNMANEIQNINNVPALSHLTCASSDHQKVQSVLQELKESGIENVLALRGDIPAEVPFPRPNQYRHAAELVREIASCGDFCIGGACYPEGHPEAESLEQDILYIKDKVTAGCQFLTTQMFFDNNILYSYLYKLMKRGVDVPVIAGIMPVTNANQITNIRKLSGTLIPARFRSIVERFGEDPKAMKQAGIAYATDQIIDLIANGVNHIHIYTMNKPEIAGNIMENLSYIIK